MAPGKRLHVQPQRQPCRRGGLARIMVRLFISVVVLWPMHPGHATDLTHEQLYAVAAPGVVFVYASSQQQGMIGSGSIVRSDGLVLTNAHVVLDNKTGAPHDHLWVALKPDRVTGNFDEDLQNRFPAGVQAFNRELDLALLKVTKPLPAVTVIQLGDSDQVNIGAKVVAIGHPEQGGLWTLTTGVISAFRADYGDVRGKHMFQTEASMNRGNSGGPLINGEGRQIGVNSAIARRAQDGLTITDVNFSLQSNVALKWMAKEGVTFEKAQGGRQSGGNVAGTVTTKESSKAALTVAPKRPYQFHQVDQWLAQTEQDLENMAHTMQKHIREKRDRDLGGFAEQGSIAPPSRPGTMRGEKRHATKGQDTERVGEPPEYELDCGVYETQTLDFTFGLKAGNFLFNVGPEMGVTYRSGVAWQKVVQGTIARYVELCNRYNAGMVTKTEYEARLEKIEALYREARQLQAQLMEATRRRSRSGFDELDREVGKMRESPSTRRTDLENKVEQLAKHVERLTPIGQPLEPSSPCPPPDMLGAPGAKSKSESEETC